MTCVLVGISYGYPDVRGGAPPIDFSEGVHVFSVEWDTNQINWFVDGNLYATRTQNDRPPPYGAIIPQTPFYIILNTAISWFTPPPLTSYPAAYHYIDYVRVYQPAPAV